MPIPVDSLLHKANTAAYILHVIQQFQIAFLFKIARHDLQSFFIDLNRYVSWQ